VKRDTLAGQLRTTGTIAASEKGLGVIQVRFAGWIEKLFVEQTGERVNKGEVLATIHAPDVLAVQQEYLNALRWSAADSARTALPAAPGNFKEDARRRLELLGISASEIAEIERTGQAMRAVPLRSPVTGYVTQKNAIQGSYVQPATALFEVANLSTVWALADVYQHELARVRIGQPVTMELASFPGETFAGKVSFIYPTLDPATRTLRVRMEFANKDLRLKPGMFGNVEIGVEGAEGLVVPREALVDTGTQQYVFVAKPGGLFEPRRVTTGSRERDDVQILSGLTEGEVVVTTANFLLDSESRLRAAIEGAAPEPQPADAPPRRAAPNAIAEPSK
jgi:Cu(I)/Ag(I) efflux system membrane fusion protein